MSKPGCDGCALSRVWVERMCCGRDDLPPAYGQHHPLRRLPADRGKSCGARVSVEAAEAAELARIRRAANRPERKA